VEAARAVGAVLVEREAHEALQAGEQDATLRERVLVVERDLAAGNLAAAVGVRTRNPGGRYGGATPSRSCRAPPTQHW
jgi:hypothetical protein